MNDAREGGVDGADTHCRLDCFHCGEPVPPEAHFTLVLDGRERAMCCPGCLAVAGMIDASGLQRFYSQRTAYSPRPADTPEALHREELALYDDPAFRETFCTTRANDTVRARLLVGGITCAACTWLIEHSLRQLPGVNVAEVNLAQARLELEFDPGSVALSHLVETVSRLGYRIKPYRRAARREMLEQDQRQSLRRLAAAGIGMMQVGMFAIALHAGDLQGMDPVYRHFLRWVSLLVATFIVFYAARPFFETAWRHLRAGALVMDLPVALAIGLAWAASTFATLANTGEVYFDSIAMFTFFLLLARFLEQRLRLREIRSWYDVEDLLPDAVRVRTDGIWQVLNRREVTTDATVLVPAGETVPVDGVVTSGGSALDESTFTGEALPRQVKTGDTVYAGTVNRENALEIRVSNRWNETRLAALQQTVALAGRAKPVLARLADRVSAWFVAAVLLLTAGTALIWLYIDPSRALWVSLSVLVISCPCALALATPTALTSAAGALRRRGIVVRGDDALESLSRATHFIFDKTGTLTDGRFRITAVAPVPASNPDDGPDKEEILALVSALQHYSTHPVSGAFAKIDPAHDIHDIAYTPGSGLEGRHGDRRIRSGSLRWCRQLAPDMPPPPDSSAYWIGLCETGLPLAWIGLDDCLRPEAHSVIATLQAASLPVTLLTGDPSPRALLLGRQLGIENVFHGLSPEEKMHHVQQLQRTGTRVAMVGDGLNDAPVLRVADTSLAVSGATDLARTQSDFAMDENDLQGVVIAWRQALACRRVILQNFGWALLYNLLALPVATAGLVPPWAAALGMSASSLLVVGNSLRLGR